MRRLLALFITLTMLSACVPSFGYILVYNISCPVKGVDDGTATSVPLKGYLVLNLDDVDGDLVDANLIIYGKNPDKEKIYAELDYTSNGFLDITTESEGDFYIAKLSSVIFLFEELILGKMKSRNVGLDEPVDVAGTLKGVFSQEDGILLDQDQNITGTAYDPIVLII